MYKYAKELKKKDSPLKKGFKAGVTSLGVPIGAFATSLAAVGPAMAGVLPEKAIIPLVLAGIGYGATTMSAIAEKQDSTKVENIKSGIGAVLGTMAGYGLGKYKMPSSTGKDLAMIAGLIGGMSGAAAGKLTEVHE